MLNGLYDTCGVGFEFAQQPDDAGVPAAAPAADAGDAGPPIPRTTIPFDISRYKALHVLGDDDDAGPDDGLDAGQGPIPRYGHRPPRRGLQRRRLGYLGCATTATPLSFLKFTTSWQQFTVLLDAGGDGGVAPSDGIAIDPTWGYQRAKWIPTQVYGVNWQAQRNIAPDAGAPLMTDIWVDDVYFIE